MPKLNQMPTRAEFGMVFSGLPGMIRIGELIDEWHISGWFTQITIAFLIERASKFIIKNTGIPNPSHMLKVGGQLTGKQYEYLQSLHEFVYDSLKTSLLTNDLEYERSIIEEFGKDVFHLQQAEDIHDLSNNRMTYLRTTGEQRPFKLSFRAGLAYKWKFKEGRKTKLKLYDTISFNERYENGGAIFTMDKNGGIYALGDQGAEKSTKHSSILGGASVLCAGGIHVKDGRLLYLVGRSGHYRPTVAQFVNVLERLKQYQIDLTDVKVFRVHHAGCEGNQTLPGWQARVGLPVLSRPLVLTCQPCDATELLRLRAWPGDNSTDKHSLWILPTERPAWVANQPRQGGPAFGGMGRRGQ